MPTHPTATKEMPNDTQTMMAPHAEISPARRAELRAAAHGLHPVVSISQKGLSPAVLSEIERSLKAHELIKIRVFEADRDVRAGWLEEICNGLGAIAVQHIGKLLVIWRENPERAPSQQPSIQPPRHQTPRLTKKAAAAKTDKQARARSIEKGRPRRPTRTR